MAIVALALPLSVPAADITPTAAQSDCVFNWAEAGYPAYFAPAGTKSISASPYYYRHYSQVNAYLGTSSADGHLYYLGPVSENTLVDLGAAQKWLDTAGCAYTPADGMPVTINESATATTSTSGGTTAIADGTSIDIPAGALATSTAITVTKTNAPSSSDVPEEMQSSANGTFYKFEPDGLIMNSKALVTLPYGNLPAGVQPGDLTIGWFDGQGWVDLPVASVNSAQGTVSFRTDHFTMFRLSRSLNPVYGSVFGGPAYKTSGINVGICGGYLNADFKLGFDSIGGLGWLSLHNISYGRNPIYETAYKVELRERAWTGLYNTIRTIHVYSVIFQDYYDTSGVSYRDIAVGDPFGFPKWKGATINTLAAGTNQMAVGHRVEVFDGNGNKLSGYGGDEYFMDNTALTQSELQTLVADYYFHPTRSAKFLNAIPSTLLVAGKTYKIEVDVQSVINGYINDTHGHYESDTFTTDPNAKPNIYSCAGITLPIPSISITSPAASEKFFDDQTAITFTADAKDSTGTALSSIVWKSGSSCTDSQGDSILTTNKTSFATKLKAGTHFVSAQVTDSAGRVNRVCRSLTVTTHVNSPPEIVSNPSLASVQVGNTYSYTVHYKDPDLDRVTFRLSSAPKGMTIDSAGNVTWTPASADAGQKTFSVIVTDQHGATATQEIDLAVLPQPNNSPQVKLMIYGAATAPGDSVALEAQASDADGDALTYTWSASGGSLFDVSGSEAWFRATTAGTYKITVKVSDGKATVSRFGYLEVQAVVPPELVSYTVSGKVTANGAGLAGATVILGGNAATAKTTDANGNYSFGGLLNGAYTLTVSLDGYSVSPTNRSVSVSNANAAGNDFAATAYSHTWTPGDWGNCNGSLCGTDNGMQSRSVTCLRSDGATAADSSCIGPKPDTSRACTASVCVYSYDWVPGTYGSCIGSCGTTGEQTRTVTCTRSDNIQVADSFCSTTKLGSSQSCQMSACTTASTATRPLNDTGITTYGDSSSNSLTSEPSDYPGQDARYGRDAQAAAGTLVKTGGGSNGFDFTKIANDGTELPALAALGTGTKDWACTRDNVTGLIWEIQTTSGLRSQDHTYTWYNSGPTSNGGDAGTVSGGTCLTSGRCDTEKYVQDVNAATLCGHADWRIPDQEELVSIVDYGKTTPPAIDTDWFPNTPASEFWSASAFAQYSGGALLVDFFNGAAHGDHKSDGFKIRLVRAGQ